MRCWPNPFNPETELSFELAAAAHARVVIHDSRGRLVDVLHDGQMPAGGQRLIWNPRGLASGIYLASVQIDGVVADVSKVSLVK